MRHLKKQVETLAKAHDTLAKRLGGAVQTIWNNQVELSKSVTLLDEQFAVSTRMSVMGINMILDRMEAEEQIKQEDIELLFQEWADFRARPDFRDLMLEWMLGVPLSELPPVPEPPTKEGEKDAKSDRGDQVSAEGESQDRPPCQKDDVPEVPCENQPSG